MTMADLERLAVQAGNLRDSLDKSKSMSEKMITILSTFDNRLSTLETTMKPIQAQTQKFRTVQENLHATIKNTERILVQYEIPRQVEPRLKEGPVVNLENFLSSLDKLQTSISFFSQHRKYLASETALNHCQPLLRESILKLEDNFRSSLKTLSRLLINFTEKDKTKGTKNENGDDNYADKDGNDDNDDDNLKISSEKDKNNMFIQYENDCVRLNLIAQQLIKSGSASACIKSYCDIRSVIIEEKFKKRHGEFAYKEDEFQNERWKLKVDSWIKSLQYAMNDIFIEEKLLCENVFMNIESMNERCYAEILDVFASKILSFGNNVSKNKQFKTPENLFVFLGIYEAMRELKPQSSVVFSGKTCHALHVYFCEIFENLSILAKETFEDFEILIQRDISKPPASNGDVHEYTSYVVNYLKLLLDYEKILFHLLNEEGDSLEAKGEGKETENSSKKEGAEGEDAKKKKEDSEGERRKEGEEENIHLEKSSQKLSNFLVKIFSIFQNVLDKNSKHIKDSALMHIFLMNNTHYIVCSVSKWEQGIKFLGKDWIRRQRRVVEQHATAYQRAAWAKIIASLSTTGLTSSDTRLLKPILKERFKSFNSAFDELHSRQRGWIIREHELREAVRLKVAEIIIPAYRSFLKRYRPIMDQGRNPGKYIKYSPEAIDRMLGDFFENKST